MEKPSATAISGTIRQGLDDRHGDLSPLPGGFVQANLKSLVESNLIVLTEHRDVVETDNSSYG